MDCLETVLYQFSGINGSIPLLAANFNIFCLLCTSNQYLPVITSIKTKTIKR